MIYQQTSSRRRSIRLTAVPWFWLAAAAAICSGGAVQGEEVMRVEEDWIIVVGQPDAGKTAPQLLTVMSPYGNISSVHAIFELNHKTQPDYVAGGMQLQSWVGNTLLSHKTNPLNAKLATANEVIQYTIVMSITNGTLQFEIKNGTSATWGTFGGQGYLKTSVNTSPDDLNDYNSNLTIQQSKVGYGANRVQLFARTAVRYYTATGTLISQDTTQKNVHETSGN